MTQGLKEVKISAQPDTDLPLTTELVNQALQCEPSMELLDRALQYEDAPLEEIFDLLEESIESYVTVAPNLPPALRSSAKKETEFFAWLFQERISELIDNLHPPEHYLEHYDISTHLVA